MTRMKWLRRGLLGGVALGALTTGAQADELADLKAQLAALQARVAQIEAAPRPAAVPEGTSLVTARRGQLTSSVIVPEPVKDRMREHQGFTFAISPTADMPLPTTEVTVSGQVRARALFISDEDFLFFDGYHDGSGGFNRDNDDDDDDFPVVSARL